MKTYSDFLLLLIEALSKKEFASYRLASAERHNHEFLKTKFKEYAVSHSNVTTNRDYTRLYIPLETTTTDDFNYHDTKEKISNLLMGVTPLIYKNFNGVLLNNNTHELSYYKFAQQVSKPNINLILHDKQTYNLNLVLMNMIRFFDYYEIIIKKINELNKDEIDYYTKNVVKPFKGITSSSIPNSYNLYVLSYADYINNILNKINKLDRFKIQSIIDEELLLCDKFNSEFKEKILSVLELIKQVSNTKPQKITKSLIISSNPYDIATMSTDRGWRSCMHVRNGINKEYVIQDIKEGTIIAYVTNDIDRKKLRSPSTRVLIKPYINTIDNKEIIWVPSETKYGEIPSRFELVFNNTIIDFCQEINKNIVDFSNSNEFYKSYMFNSKLYKDNDASHIFKYNDQNKELSKEQIEELINDEDLTTIDLNKLAPSIVSYALTINRRRIRYLTNPTLSNIQTCLTKNSDVFKFINKSVSSDILIKLILDLIESKEWTIDDIDWINYISNESKTMLQSMDNLYHYFNKQSLSVIGRILDYINVIRNLEYQSLKNYTMWYNIVEHYPFIVLFTPLLDSSITKEKILPKQIIKKLFTKNPLSALFILYFKSDIEHNISKSFSEICKDNELDFEKFALDLNHHEKEYYQELKTNSNEIEKIMNSDDGLVLSMDWSKIKKQIKYEISQIIKLNQDKKKMIDNVFDPFTSII